MVAKTAYITGFVKRAQELTDDEIPEELLQEVALKAYADQLIEEAERSGWMHKNEMRYQSGKFPAKEEFTKYRRLYRQPKEDDEKAWKKRNRFRWQIPLSLSAMGGLAGAGVGAMYGDMDGQAGKGAGIGAIIGAALALAAFQHGFGKANKVMRAELTLGKRWPKNAPYQP